MHQYTFYCLLINELVHGEDSTPGAFSPAVASNCSLVTSTLICFSEILAPPCPSWAHVLSEIRYKLEIKSFFSSEMLKNILQIMRIIPSKDAKASSSKQIITCGPDWTIQHWVIVFRIFSVSKWFRIS